MTNDPATPLRAAGCLVRLYWISVGNLFPLLLLILIWKNKPALASLPTLAYWVSVLLLVAVRYYDVRVMHGATAYGEPATIGHWRRYAALVGSVTLGAWALARLVPWS